MSIYESITKEKQNANKYQGNKSLMSIVSERYGIQPLKNWTNKRVRIYKH